MRRLQPSLPCFKMAKLASTFWTESILPDCREVSRSVTLLVIKFRRGVKERNPSLKERIDSFRTACGAQSVQSAEGVSTSAEVDLRLRLKKPQTFEKV